MLNKAAILSALDLKRETVTVTEWGGDVVVQEMTALDRDRLQAETNTDGNLDLVNYAARVLVRCLANEDGTRLFDDSEADELGKKSPAVLSRLFDVASRLNGTDTAIDDQAKNSEPGQTDFSPSASA